MVDQPRVPSGVSGGGGEGPGGLDAGEGLWGWGRLRWVGSKSQTGWQKSGVRVGLGVSHSQGFP